MKKKTKKEPKVPTGIPDLIAKKRTEMTKHNDRAANFEDSNWCQEQSVKAKDKAAASAIELEILTSAETHAKLLAQENTELKASVEQLKFAEAGV